METKALFYRSLDQASSVIAHLTTEDFTRATPDTEWDAKTLANHMLYELSWIPEMLAGRTLTEVGAKYDGDLIADNPQDNWQTAADAARVSVDTASLDGTAHLSYGDVSTEDYLRQVSGDLLIHSWDLAAALGYDRQLDPEAAATVYEGIKPQASELHKTGLFKPPLDVPDSADLQTRLLAIFGRDAGWKNPSKDR